VERVSALTGQSLFPEDGKPVLLSEGDKASVKSHLIEVLCFVFSVKCQVFLLSVCSLFALL